MNLTRLQIVLDFIKQYPHFYDHTADLTAYEMPTEENPKCLASIAAYFNNDENAFRSSCSETEALKQAAEYLEVDDFRQEDMLFHITWFQYEPQVDEVINALERILAGADVGNAIDQVMHHPGRWRNAEPGTPEYTLLTEGILDRTEYIFWEAKELEVMWQDAEPGTSEYICLMQAKLDRAEYLLRQAIEMKAARKKLEARKKRESTDDQ